MKLYLLPDKGNYVYSGAVSAEGVLMDCQVVDTAGFVSLIEEKFGYPKERVSANHRVCRYYMIMRRWFDDHTDNVLYSSYKLNGLAMARQMLNWHDELKLAGWDFEHDDLTSRLGALASIGKEFALPGLGDRIQRAMECLQNCSVDRFADLEIIIPYNIEWFVPAVRSLVERVGELGAKVEVMQPTKRDTVLGRIGAMLLPGANVEKSDLTPDGSLKIFKFKTPNQLEEYFANNPEKSSQLWINADGKALDNRLVAEGKPATGSRVQVKSHITSLIPLLVALYIKPLNQSTLLDWLTLPEHPLPRGFRNSLAKIIVSKGSVMNEERSEIVENYLKGDYEYDIKNDTKLSEEDREKKLQNGRDARELDKRNYLPFLNTDASLRDSLKALDKWAENYIKKPRGSVDSELIVPQLDDLRDFVGNLLYLMEECNYGKDDCRKILQLFRDLQTTTSLPQHHAQVGAAFQIANPGDMIAEAESTLWLGLDGSQDNTIKASFLLPSEQKAIEHATKFQSARCISEINQHNLAVPFLMTSRCLTLCYSEECNGQKLKLHPLILRLMAQIPNFEDFVEEPKCDAFRVEEYTSVKNSEKKDKFKISNPEKISFPKEISPTRLESLIYNPFDFFFDSLVKIISHDDIQLSNIQKTRGIVAHAFIEKHFGKFAKNGGKVVAPTEDEFNHLLAEAKNECGAIFDLSENKLAYEVFRKQLFHCVKNLAEIIGGNNLKVIKCEDDFSLNLGLIKSDNKDVSGIIDMVLEDENGGKIIFDFKWTGKGETYEKLLEENTSVQLAIYQTAIEAKSKEVVATAYFLMPRGKLVTTSTIFKNGYVEVIQPANEDSVFDKIKNSYRYRKNQITSNGNGFLEGSEEELLTSIEYHNDMDANNLLPLRKEEKDKDKKGDKKKKENKKEDKKKAEKNGENGNDDKKEEEKEVGVKQKNRYSDYQLLKGLK